MKRVILLLIICMSFCLITGCCNPAPIRPQSVNPQSTYNASSSRPFPAIPSSIEIAWKPRPTETIPAMYQVQIGTYKNPLASDPYISITFQGGAGQIYTQSMEALVLRSDNRVEYEVIAYPQVGSQIILNGTTGTDRLIVDIIMANQKYRVVDELMPLKTYG